MPNHLRVVHHPERMAYTVHEWTDMSDGRRMARQADGTLVEIHPGGELPVAYSIDEQLVPQLLSQLGMPLTDSHLLDALRHERGRVDRLIDTAMEAITRGL